MKKTCWMSLKKSPLEHHPFLFPVIRKLRFGKKLLLLYHHQYDCCMLGFYSIIFATLLIGTVSELLRGLKCSVWLDSLSATFMTFLKMMMIMMITTIFITWAWDVCKFEVWLIFIFYLYDDTIILIWYVKSMRWYDMMEK